MSEDCHQERDRAPRLRRPEDCPWPPTRSVGRGGVALLSLSLLLSGCSPGSSSGPDEVPLGPCPPPGIGIAMAGVGGVGNAVSTPLSRLVLMGGGAENDEASTLFVESAQGGDIIVLRASGSVYTYPNYFFFGLLPSVKPSSVNTILTTLPEYGKDESVICRLKYAEAIWLAGGNQWDYLIGWPSELHSGLAEFLARGGAMGGTSAGAMSLGEAAFDAREGTLFSQTALQDPLSPLVSLSYPSFAHPKLQNTLVDTHFSQEGREGRMMALLARFLVEKGKAEVVGVGLDEGVALVLDSGGFRVFGPEGQGAWMYRVTGPATLREGEPLDLMGILRVRLEPGSQGEWPLDFDAAEGEELKVEGGVVGPG